MLLGCVKTKSLTPARARELYVSPLWKSRRSYAERSGGQWAILSAKHGLVLPDEELEPYDLALHDLSAAERTQWGDRAVERLVEWLGPLDGLVFEIHAGAVYRSALAPGLEEHGATTIAPLRGLQIGQQLAWYKQQQPAIVRRRHATESEVAAALVALDAAPQIVPAKSWPGQLSGLAQPGLYSWWVDSGGAEALTEAFGIPVEAGRIYAGQTGATKWPSGATGKNTLRKRIAQHIRGGVHGSTFRLTLGAALIKPLRLRVTGPKKLESEAALTEWILEHLSVAVHTFADPDPLADLEHHVLSRLDPPLNLDGMADTPVRQRLRVLRAALSTP